MVQSAPMQLAEGPGERRVENHMLPAVIADFTTEVLLWEAATLAARSGFELETHVRDPSRGEAMIVVKWCVTRLIEDGRCTHPTPPQREEARRSCSAATTCASCAACSAVYPHSCQRRRVSSTSRWMSALEKASRPSAFDRPEGRASHPPSSDRSPACRRPRRPAGGVVDGVLPAIRHHLHTGELMSRMR
jgi:hypothetical protein